MSGRIKQHTRFLRLLQESTTRKRKALIESITNTQLDALSQLILNIVQGNILVTDAYIKKLKCYKDIIHSLATRKVCRVKRDALIKLQRLLSFILKPALLLLNG